MSEPRPGRVLSHDEALAVGHRLLDMVSGQSLGVQIEHTGRAVTTMVDNRFSGWHVGDELSIKFTSQFGSGWPVWIATNELTTASLEQVVKHAATFVPPPQNPADALPPDPDDPNNFTLNPRPFLPVSLWHDATAQAMEQPMSEVVTAMTAPVTAAGLMASATLAVQARSILYLYRPGLTAWAHETDCEVTMMARTPDGTVTGWGGQANRDWTQITPASVAMTAVDFAQRGRQPLAVEPGRYTVILGPAAVAQLVRLMAEGFNASAREGPFWIGPDGPTRVGQRVFDERLTMRSDPDDPDGGFPPFYEDGGWWPYGLPIPRMTWVEGGVLKNLAYDLRHAVGRVWSERPYSMRVAPMPGVQTATIADMIAACQHGIYVNRFANVSVVDQATGLMTGVTRDGCFQVKNGKLTTPVRNLRFLESPFLAFNRLMMVGAAERAALGYAAPSDMNEYWSAASWPPTGRWTRWPRVPIIVPPMMIEDFAFISVADNF